MFLMLKKKDLINFENKIADLFNKARIKAPVHLHSNNEDQLIKIFKQIKKKDWIFCSWRSHYHCLLKGVPQKTLEKEILQGKSISLCFPEYNLEVCNRHLAYYCCLNGKHGSHNLYRHWFLP